MDTQRSTQPSQLGTQFGDISFSADEADEIKKLLEKKLSKEQIAYRVGPGGRELFIHHILHDVEKVPYLESWRAIEIANSIFGFSGWSSSVINLSQDYVRFIVYIFLLQMDIDSNGKVSCGVSAVVRVQLKDGSFHEVHI